MTERAGLRSRVSERLRGRRLVYFGTRGDDAEGVGDLPELDAIFSVVAAPRQRHSTDALALEDLTGRRVDLDSHDIDEDHGPEVVELRRAILRALLRESVVFTYRPSSFLSSICFARQDRCEYAGMFKDHQVAFEHKPWVESSVRALGIPSIPWTYIADEEQLETLRYLEDGPVVLRTSRSSGGTGITKLDRSADLLAAWPSRSESFVSVAPYIAGGVPTNVSGVVWHDGVTLHPPSVQIIGVRECTTRPFGYCGNDFGAMQDVQPRLLDRMEESTTRIGRWLQSFGYVGAFGVDYLLTDKEALFTEINPRLQGVTHLACQVAVAADESCVMLEHLAASLGLDAPSSRPLRQQVAETPGWAHFVAHWMGGAPGTVDGERLHDEAWAWDETRRTDVVPAAAVTLDPCATALRLSVESRLTQSGFDLVPPWNERLAKLAMTYLRSDP